jgi:lactoylglutathione lyase
MRIGFVVLGVGELERAIVFYRDLMGFPLVHANPTDSFAQFDAGGIGLKIVGKHPPTSSQHSVVEIVVEDIQAAHAELSAKGVEFPLPPTRQPWGGWLAQLRDPDGNLLYLSPASR